MAFQSLHMHETEGELFPTVFTGRFMIWGRIRAPGLVQRGLFVELSMLGEHADWGSLSPHEAELGQPGWPTRFSEATPRRACCFYPQMGCW